MTPCAARLVPIAACLARVDTLASFASGHSPHDYSSLSAAAFSLDPRKHPYVCPVCRASTQPVARQ